MLYYSAKGLSYTYIYTLFYIVFRYGLSQDSEYSFLCYTLETLLSKNKIFK